MQGSGNTQVKVDPVKLSTELAARRQVADANAHLKAQALQLMAQLARVLGAIK